MFLTILQNIFILIKLLNVEYLMGYLCETNFEVGIGKKKSTFSNKY